jgi:hypothetical protein
MFRGKAGSARDLVELVLGYGIIVGVIWMPEFPQRVSRPLVLIVTLAVVLARHPSREELGLGWHGFLPSLWVLPAAAVIGMVSVLVAKRLGTLHPLFNGDVQHIAGYVLWTLYQQFLLNDYFLPRLTRLLGDGSFAVSAAAVLFAGAHLPNLWLTVATLVWGAISCALFRRYRNLYVLGVAQGMLGLCFAVCVPDALHHHLRVGLGYLRYHR